MTSRPDRHPYDPHYIPKFTYDPGAPNDTEILWRMLGMEKKESKVEGKRPVVVALTAAAVSLVLLSLVVLPVWWHFGPRVEYQREVHGYMVNAYYSNTPELMVENLQQARDGMVALGLRAELYGGLYPWEKTPDNRMSFTYDLIDSIIRRAEAVADDRERQIKAGTSDEFKDVFEEKMDNLRNFIKEEGWADDIAEDAYRAHNYSWYYLWTSWPFALAQIAFFLSVLASGIVRLCKIDDEWLSFGEWCRVFLLGARVVSKGRGA